MTGYIGQAPGQGQIQYFTFTATAGQTTFTGVDANSYVLNYSPGFCDVFLNGRRLTPISDYTATDGSTIVLQSAASLNDVIFVASASTFDTADWVTNAINYVYTASAGQTTFTGADDNANTLSYVNGTILVSLNGINLPQSDFTATNGSTVVLNSGVNAGDIVQIFSLRTMAVVSFLPLSGGTITGSLTVGNSSVNTYITAGNIALNGSTLLIGNSSANVVINGSSLVISNSTTTATVGLGPATINSLASNTFTIGTGTYFVANGNVGIGSTNPLSKLVVSDAGSYGIEFQPNDTNRAFIITYNRSGAAYYPLHFTSSTYNFRDTSGGYSMVIDGSGNMGIGTASPNFKFDVRGGRAQFAPSSEAFAIGLRYNDSTNGVWLGSPAANSFQISTAGGSAVFNIDGSGRVTQPYQPAFWAYGSGSQSWSGSTVNTKVNFSSGGQIVTSNKSSGWNQSNSRFTAPVAGSYEFIVTFACSTVTATGPAGLIAKNGSGYWEVCISYYNTSYAQCTGSIIVDLAVNDYVEFWIANYNNTSFTVDLARCKFSGKLIS